MTNEHTNFENEEDDEIEVNSLNPMNLEYVESSIKNLGKHLSDLSREEELS